MPQVSAPFLLFAAAWVVLARICPRGVWPLARDGLGLGLMLWLDGRSALALTGAGVCVWFGGRWRTERVFWGGLGALLIGFIAVRALERVQAPGEDLTPLGFGFAALRLGLYWVEQGAGGLPPHRLRELLAWLFYFPTVLVGPLQRFDDWLRWERRRRWDDADAANGLWRVLHGYVLVVVLGAGLVGRWLPGRLLELPPGLAGTLVGVGTLYLSFAGLSSLAIGLGRVAGQRVPENFAMPWLATDLREFWRRWHMTVTEWCRSYVYLPLLARTRNPWLAAGAAMGVFALWHELSLGMLAWGGWQGLGLALWHRLAPEQPGVLGQALGWVLTMGWVIAGFWALRVWPEAGLWATR